MGGTEVLEPPGALPLGLEHVRKTWSEHRFRGSQIRLSDWCFGPAGAAGPWTTLGVGGVLNQCGTLVTLSLSLVQFVVVLPFNLQLAKILVSTEPGF